MSTVLYITANPKEVERSFSLRVGEEFFNSYMGANPEDEVIKIDLYNTEIPEVDFDLLQAIENLRKGISPAQLSEQLRNKLTVYDQFTEQFVKADKYIFVTPMWNLGLPARVKAYIDTVCVAGKTFKYTEKGPQGLLENKKCLHVHASGGYHSKDPHNHADPFLKDIMQFMGVKDYKALVIEGHGAIPEKAETIIREASTSIPELVKWLAV
jgi:FMN-dependent NADH-azoreductase